MIQITAIPKKDRNSAATRLRYYGFLDHLPKDFGWGRHKKKFKDILFVQKRADSETIKIASKAKKRGVPFVYDIDDPAKNKYRIKLLKMADVITTDTVKRREHLSQFTPAPIVVVAPHYDYLNQDREPLIIGPLKSVITFGNKSGLVYSLSYLAEAKEYKRKYIYREKVTNDAKFIKWKEKRFLHDVKKGDVCILIHGGKSRDIKSNCKLLTMMSIGIPTLVSDSCYFAEAVRKVGFPELIITKPKEMNKKLEYLKPIEIRKEIQKRFLNYAYEHATPEKSGEKLANVFRGVL